MVEFEREAITLNPDRWVLDGSKVRRNNQIVADLRDVDRVTSSVHQSKYGATYMSIMMYRAGELPLEIAHSCDKRFPKKEEVHRLRLFEHKFMLRYGHYKPDGLVGMTLLGSLGIAAGVIVLGLIGSLLSIGPDSIEPMQSLGATAVLAVVVVLVVVLRHVVIGSVTAEAHAAKRSKKGPPKESRIFVNT